LTDVEVQMQNDVSKLCEPIHSPDETGKMNRS
jgi:hypothetical protein